MNRTTYSATPVISALKVVSLLTDQPATYCRQTLSIISFSEVNPSLKSVHHELCIKNYIVFLLL